LIQHGLLYSNYNTHLAVYCAACICRLGIKTYLSVVICMNKIHIYIVLFLLIISSGCKPDPALVPANLRDEALLGKWLLKSVNIITQVDTNTPTQMNYNTFTDKDFFEFKASNAAMYSSTLIGKAYEGYYSANADLTPNPLVFKSGNFSATFYIESVTPTELVIYQTTSNTLAGVTTSVTNYYTYKH